MHSGYEDYVPNEKDEMSVRSQQAMPLFRESSISTSAGYNNVKADVDSEVAAELKFKTRSEFEVISRELDNQSRVYLRPLSGDLRDYTNWINNPDNSRGLNMDMVPITSSVIAEKLASKDNKPCYDIVYVNGKSATHIGIAEITILKNSSRHGVITILIGLQRYQGKHIGRAVIDMLCEIAFTSLNINSLSLTVSEDNIKALKCYEACGFKRQGVLRNRVFHNGRYFNSIYMDMLSSEYRGNSNAEN